MATADADFAFVLAAVRRLLDGFRDEVTARTKPGERGMVLAHHIGQTLAAIEGRIDHEEERYDQRVTPESKSAGARALRFYAQLVWATHDALRWLAPQQQLDLGALYFADKTAVSLVGRGIEVVPVDAPEYMYSTSSWPFRWLFEQYLQEEMPEEGDRPIVLAYPAHERHTMLLHCLFVHELGHAAVDAHDLVNRVLEPTRADGVYTSELDAVVAVAGRAAARVRRSAEDRAESWVEELLCDAVAFRYLGPAYLFAFAEMGLSVSWSDPGEDHPSTTLRTSLLIDLAKESGWDRYLEERVPEIWEWLKSASTTPTRSGDLLSDFAESVAERARPGIAEAVRDVVTADFSVAEFEEQEAHFGDLLTNDILPVERKDGTTAKHAEILLAAWLQAIDKHGKGPAAISASVSEAEYQRFVAKALEMTTLVTIWEEVSADAVEA